TSPDRRVTSRTCKFRDCPAANPSGTNGCTRAPRPPRVPARPLPRIVISPVVCGAIARGTPMVTFSQPLFLLLLLAVPPLVWWRRQGRFSLGSPSADRFAGLPAGRAGRARRLGAAFRAVALTLLVVALAGPRWPDVGTRIPTEGIAVVMLVDVSGSMADEDFTW